MSTIRERLIERYAEHYGRTNVSIDPTRLPPDLLRYLDRQFKDLVASIPNGGAVLDVGCGTGQLLYWLKQQPGIVPVGVDSSSSQVEIARRALPDVEVVCTDGLEYMQSRPSTFAAVFCTDVLEHIPGKDLLGEWVSTIHDCLKPGGFVFCRMPNAASLIGSFCRYRDLTHECSFTTTSMLQLLESGGFENCRVVPIVGADFSARLRLAIEYWMHRIIYRICGEGLEKTFTSNICAVGYKR